MSHRCHAMGCACEIPPKFLMCHTHWAMVPNRLQKEIWSHYRPGQETDKNPSPKYLQAMREAIAAVAQDTVI